MGLVFVPTPLGNLRDVTLRSVDVLREASLVVAEDSRVARRLLSALDVTGKEIWTYHEHNARATTAAILERARAETVAVVTDAGTPGISDPGAELVAAARAAGVAVEVLPGATAFVCAAVLSGFDLRRFAFAGFPPRGSAARREAFRGSLGETTVWYEAPHRARAALADLAAVAPGRRVFLVRELSKLHEQQVLGTAAEVAAALDDPVRGELALVVEGAPAERPVEAPSAADLDAAIDALVAEGLTTSAIAKRLADAGHGARRHLYARVGERRTGRAEPG
ncbi:MAG TPA: 16S rRNA (cytidine(1402)-2'-O)-methyltransferase [Candidatus Elarobacter sp.]|jgi:16S rRNA (cytidine1402-2'-O)-methyltransferase|nr:16S rRNA (cytidine(1402)-2'-O)-methyltransferase [Candidatus Elarobacter sp.]